MNFLFTFSLVLSITAGIAAIGSCFWLADDYSDTPSRTKVLLALGFMVVCAILAGIAAQANSVLP